MSLDEQSVIGNEGIRAVAGYGLSVFIGYWNHYLNLAIQHTSDVYLTRMHDFYIGKAIIQNKENIKIEHYYTPRFNEVEKGGILVSPCPSVRLPVCGQDRGRSVSSTILIGSISYLHILSNNFRGCVACNARVKTQTFETLAIFLNL